VEIGFKPENLTVTSFFFRGFPALIKVPFHEFCIFHPFIGFSFHENWKKSFDWPTMNAYKAFALVAGYVKRTFA
jgi:hypothetical protein